MSYNTLLQRQAIAKQAKQAYAGNIVAAGASNYAASIGKVKTVVGSVGKVNTGVQSGAKYGLAQQKSGYAAPIIGRPANGISDMVTSSGAPLPTGGYGSQTVGSSGATPSAYVPTSMPAPAPGPTYAPPAPDYQAQATYAPPTAAQGASWSAPTQDFSSQSGSASLASAPSAGQPSSALVGSGMASGTTSLSTVTSQASAAPARTLWQRILAFFGFGPKTAAVSTVHGNPTTAHEAVGQLVRRARNGDQNAMAMIAEAAKQAKGGNRRAAMTVQMMHDYIKRNPAGTSTISFGAEPSNVDPLFAKAVALSHTGLLSNPRIGDTLAALSPEEQDAFLMGMQGRPTGKRALANANAAGYVVGQARKLQSLRMSHVPIGRHDALVAWELGET